MDLRVNQFKVRYQGRDYGPGGVICGVDAEQAEALVAASNGEIEALPDRTAEPETAAEETDKTADVAKTTGKKADDAGELPKVDPAKTVK